MEKIVRFKAAYDKRHVDPKKNYGIHGLQIFFVLKGKLGAISFSLSTNWQLPHVQKEWESKDGEFSMFRDLHTPRASDISYHSPIPMFEGQRQTGATRLDFEDRERLEGTNIDFPKTKETGTFTPCEWLDGKPCYSEGSGFDADRYFNALLEGGDEGLWKTMEEYYEIRFGTLE